MSNEKKFIVSEIDMANFRVQTAKYIAYGLPDNYYYLCELLMSLLSNDKLKSLVIEKIGEKMFKILYKKLLYSYRIYSELNIYRSALEDDKKLLEKLADKQKTTTFLNEMKKFFEEKLETKISEISPLNPYIFKLWIYTISVTNLRGIPISSHTFLDPSQNKYRMHGADLRNMEF